MARNHSTKSGVGTGSARRTRAGTAATEADHSTNSGPDTGSKRSRAVAGFDLAIEHRLLASLVPYARNARTHSDEQVAQIAASIREFGWTNPILVDGENGVIAGHGRVLAARKLELASVPVIELAGLSEAQRRAYVLADNKLALNAGWNEQMLALKVADLVAMGVDLDLAGFGAGDGDQLLVRLDAHPGLTDPDEVPDEPEIPVSRPGDVWLLGRHRLVCGDSTDPEMVALALDGIVPHLMVTDPPYGVEYDANWRNEAGRALDGTTQRLASGKAVKPLGARAVGKVLNDDRADWREAWVLFPGDVAYVWHAGNKAHIVAESLDAAGFRIAPRSSGPRASSSSGEGTTTRTTNPAGMPSARSRAPPATGRATASSRRSGRSRNRRRARPGIRPGSRSNACAARSRTIPPRDRRSTSPFSCSGTTIIAATMTGRVCHAIELNPAYVDVAVERWQAFAGGEAILESKGKSFEDIARERNPERLLVGEPA